MVRLQARTEIPSSYWEKVRTRTEVIFALTLSLSHFAGEGVIITDD